MTRFIRALAGLVLTALLCAGPVAAQTPSQVISLNRATADTSGWVPIYTDRSDRPLSYRTFPAGSISDGTTTWGQFSYYALSRPAAVGNYIGFEWTDGYATANPHLVATRRDDQTAVPNPVGPTIQSAGYAPVWRDTAAHVTHMRVKRRSGTSLASVAGISSGEARSDGSILGAMLNMQYSLFGPPPYEMLLLNVSEPTIVAERWNAFWTIQADSHQAVTAPTGTAADAINTPQNELDFAERTGLASASTKVLVNQLFGNVFNLADMTLHSNPLAGYVDLGATFPSVAWDFRAVVLADRWTLYARPAGSLAWTKLKELEHPATGRFQSAPVYVQLDAKAGYRWSDNPGWVKSVDGSTPDFEWTWGTLQVRVPPNNVPAWTNRTIDPALIPALSQTWNNAGAGPPSAVDNSQAVGTVLANLTSSPGYTYAAYGAAGVGAVGNQLQITGPIAAGARELTTWATRTADGAQFLVNMLPLTVLDNLAWWDDSAALSINFETSQAYAGAVHTNVWSTYFDGSGNPTSTLQALLPGFAANGTLVLKGQGGATGFQGLYGYTDPTSRGRFAFQFTGNGASSTVGFKDGGGTDQTVTIAGMTASSSPVGLALNWTASRIKACGNGGTVASSVTTFQTTTASAPVIWADGFAANNWAGTKQRMFIYNTGSTFLTNAAIQGYCAHL